MTLMTRSTSARARRNRYVILARVSEQAAPTPAAGSQAVARFRFDIWFFVIAGAVFVIDQLSKAGIRAWLDPGEAWPDRDWFVNIVHVSNSGAAFGMLQGQTAFLIVTSLIGLGAILLYYLYPPMDHGLLKLALALQLGGAMGNLIDRIRTGEVTDFVNFRHFPAFNVADSCITIGVVTILWFFLVMEGDRRRSTPESEHPTKAESDSAPAD
jgi:signal peptidase II